MPERMTDDVAFVVSGKGSFQEEAFVASSKEVEDVQTEGTNGVAMVFTFPQGACKRD